MISVSTLHYSELFNKLSKIPEINKFHFLYGDYDIITKIEAKDYEIVGEILLQKIRTIDGILYTPTLTEFKFY